MKILSKASCDINQIKDRMHKGFKYIEIQLTKEFFEDCSPDKYQHIMSDDWDIQHMHMPFIPRQSDLPIEYIGHPKCMEVFLSACTLAQNCANFYNHDISLIIHTTIPIETIKHLPDSFNKIIETLRVALELAPNVNFSIENGGIYSTINEEIHINSNAFDGNVEWSKHLNQELNTNRFRTTIDICHVLITRKMMDIFTHDPRTAHLEKTLGWFFEQNKELINNIHLNNMHGLGLYVDHSNSFDTSDLRDMEILDAVFELYKQHNLSCNITLEIEEQSYLNANRAQRLKDLICKRYPDIKKI